MNNDFIGNVNKIAAALPSLIGVGAFLTPDVKEVLKDLNNLNIAEVVEDLQKGNYLGNRKIDIDLGLNNNITTSAVSYSAAKVVLNTGTVLNIPFEIVNQDSSVSTIELTSHTDIKDHITSHTLFTTNVVNTEVTVEEAIGENPLLIRFRDSDGFASNIDKIILTAYSGNLKEAKPSYFWAKTTSSLETIANRVGDIIALGNDIDSIISLSEKREEVQGLFDIRDTLSALYEDLNKLKTIYLNMDNIIDVNANELNINKAVANELNINKAVSNESNINKVVANKNNIDAAVKNEFNINKAVANESNINLLAKKIPTLENINENINDILKTKDHAQTASEKAKEATDIRNEIINFNPKVVHVAASEPVSISYNSTTGEYTILMPKGLKGDRGEAFKIEASGTLASRSAFDGASKGFAFLSLDESPTKVYFKATDTSGDWTVGIAFGKGDKGERGYGISNISLTNTSNLVDTYTITFEDSTTFTFNVTNGSGDMQTANNLSDVVASIARDNLSIYSKAEINTFISNINEILLSDDTTLDEIQELVNFIKQNKTDLQSLDLNNIAGLVNALSNKVDKSQVQKNVPAGAKFTDTNTHRAISESLTSTSKSVSASSNALRVVSGKVLDASNAAASALAEAKKKVEKDSAGDITVRLIRSKFTNQSTISSSAAICFRNKPDGDNYMRFVTQASFLNWLIAGGAKLTDTNTHRAISNSVSSASQSTSASSYGLRTVSNKANAAAKKAIEALNRASKPGFSLYTRTEGRGHSKRTAPSGYQFLCMTSGYLLELSSNGKEITVVNTSAKGMWGIIWAK